MKRYSIGLALVVGFLYSCGEDTFYSQAVVGDLWRVPLIKPYELITTAGASSNGYNNHWFISFKKLTYNIPKSYGGINLTKVNVKDSIIYGYGTSNPSFPFIINSKSGEEKIFFKKSEWEAALKNYGLSVDELHNIFEVFYEFKSNCVLPWNNTTENVN